MIPENMDRQNHHCRENQSDERNCESSRKAGEVEFLVIDGESAFLEMGRADGARFSFLLTAGESGTQGKSRKQLGRVRRRLFR
jgi:hypothetical protein